MIHDLSTQKGRNEYVKAMSKPKESDNMNTENNKLIAEFMGYKPHHQDSSVMIFKEGEHNDTINVKNLEYYLSWDRIIPVVEKINSYRNEDAQKIYTIESSFSNSAILRIKGEVRNDPSAYFKAPSNIEAFYEAVITFIKWYNEFGSSNS